MNASEHGLTERYAEVLREYLQQANELALTQGYEIARQALNDGHGIVELAVIHHKALRGFLAECHVADEVLGRAGEFFSECLSPFEMSHRGAREGTLALRHLNEVLEVEIKRIAHALHDEAGQLLASVHIALADMADEMPLQTRGRFDRVEKLLRQIEVELRDLSHELRPMILDNLGLLPALEFLAEKVAKRSGLAIFVSGDAEPRLPPFVETALYRIVQEALNNAVKHADGRVVKIELKCTPFSAACSISDDGIGFAPSGAPETQRLGLLGIRERLNALGGSLRVISEPGNGATIFAEIPLGG